MMETLLSHVSTAALTVALIVLGLIVLSVAVVTMAKGKRRFNASFKGFGVDVQLESNQVQTEPGALDQSEKQS